MPSLKNLIGDDVIGILSGFGFKTVSQKGSHVKLRRVLSGGTRQTLTVPRHRELDEGTVKAIFRQASIYISEAELRPHFYSE